MPPIPTAKNGREATGRFAKGNPGGPGRPRRPDLYTVATERAEAAGVDLEHELWLVCESLFEQAKQGNVQAARLLFAHLCGEPPTTSDVSVTVGTHTPLSDDERAERVRALLARAATRLDSEGKPEVAGNLRRLAFIDQDER